MNCRSENIVGKSIENLVCFFQAIETLKSFEKKDTKVACTAATNLSFLYFLVSLHFLEYLYLCVWRSILHVKRNTLD